MGLRRAGVGATVMGRRMFSGGEGSWEDDPNADAWWGDDPPFHHPVFVLTHHRRRRQGRGRGRRRGDGARLFDGGLPGAPRALESTRVIESPTGVTHLRYRAAS